jgi:ribosomal-protein-alanine N-acetyltransferase
MQESTVSNAGDYTIRYCASADVPSVIKVNSLTLPEHYSDYFYYEILKEFPTTFLLAEFEGEIIGYVMCRLEYGLSLMRRFGLSKKGHIISIAVVEEHRGRGVGTRLIKRALDEIKKASGKECYLEVRVTNKQAIDLYERLGFRVNGTLHGYYKDGESAHTMVTPL